MAKDVRNAALEAFKRSAMGAGADADAEAEDVEPEPEPEEVDAEAVSAAQVSAADTSKVKVMPGAAADSRPAKGVAKGRKGLPAKGKAARTKGDAAKRRPSAASRTGRVSPKTRASLSKGDDPAAADAKPTRAEKAGGKSVASSGGRGLGLAVLVLLVLNMVLLVICGMLFGKIDSLSGEIGENTTMIKQQGKALEEIVTNVDEARRNSVVKFGVYKDSKKGLQGAFVNYKKPNKYSVVELTPEEE